MPKNILFYDGKFVEWSTIVDGPCTGAMTRSQMFDYLWRETGYPWLPEPKGITPENRADRQADIKADAEKIARRLDRAERMGTSCMLQTEPLRTIYVQELDRDCTLLEVFATLSAPPEGHLGLQPKAVAETEVEGPEQP